MFESLCSANLPVAVLGLEPLRRPCLVLGGSFGAPGAAAPAEPRTGAARGVIAGKRGAPLRARPRPGLPCAPFGKALIRSTCLIRARNEGGDPRLYPSPPSHARRDPAGLPARPGLSCPGKATPPGSADRPRRAGRPRPIATERSGAVEPPLPPEVSASPGWVPAPLGAGPRGSRCHQGSPAGEAGRQRDGAQPAPFPRSDPAGAGALPAGNRRRSRGQARREGVAARNIPDRPNICRSARVMVNFEPVPAARPGAADRAQGRERAVEMYRRRAGEGAESPRPFPAPSPLRSLRGGRSPAPARLGAAAGGWVSGRCGPRCGRALRPGCAAVKGCRREVPAARGRPGPRRGI